MSSEVGSSPSVDIPIDPDLLELDDGRDAFDNDLGQEQSSGVDDNDEDEHVQEDEDVLVSIDTESSKRYDEDVGFNRLAGYVSRAGSAQAPIEGAGAYLQHEMDLMEQEELPQAARRLARRSQRAHKPTHEVQRLLGQANMSYIQGSHQEAITALLEVIRLDPYVQSAWTTLASCYEEMENREAARQMRFFGAHVDNDEETWKELAAEYKGIGQVPQCLYCLRKTLKIDPTDVGTLFELASIYRADKQAGKAVDAFKKILRCDAPAAHNFEFLTEFLPLMELNYQQSLAASTLREAFDYHIERFNGEGENPKDEPNTMHLGNIVALTDLLLQLDKLEEGLVVVKRGQRWLQGRRDQRSWDSIDDDREYDPQGSAREAEGEDMEGFEGFALDTALRHRLALIRLRLGDDDEAMVHIEEILSLDVTQYQSLFLEIGEALLKRDMWEKALDCFAAIQECEGIPDDPSHIYAIGICHHQMKEFTQALEALRWVNQVNPSNLEARLRLANVLEETGQKAEALEIVSDVLRARAHRSREIPQIASTANTSLNKSEKAAARKLTKRVLENQMRLKMRSLWDEVLEAEQGIDEGDPGALDQFIYAAGTMIENFRLARSNFSKSRGVVRILKSRKYGTRNDLTSQAMAMQDRLERVMGFEEETPYDEGSSKYLTVRMSEFYGMGREEWLTLIIKYCCVLMVKSEEDVAMDILEHVLWSGLFNNRRCEVALRMTINACALRTHSYDKITDNSRRLAQMHQFRPEPFLIMLASLCGGGQKAHNAWQNIQLQKFIHRELRITDEAAKGLKLHYKPSTQRWAPIVRIGFSRRLGDDVGDDPEEEEDNREDGSVMQSNDGEMGKEAPLPKTSSPILNAIYGQHMISARAYQSALFYLFRAYEITQCDPLLCLLIAQAFFGRSMNRQSDNRNYQIAQGLAFLTKYRKLSPKDQRSQEEVEYNYGRSFHGLGVAHLAVVHYERVLDSVRSRIGISHNPEEVRQNSLAQEAAHNLVLLYAASGSAELVEARSEWLAI